VSAILITSGIELCQAYKPSGRPDNSDEYERSDSDNAGTNILQQTRLSRLVVVVGEVKRGNQA
jgi:hypothetical protein